MNSDKNLKNKHKMVICSRLGWKSSFAFYFSPSSQSTENTAIERVTTDWLKLWIRLRPPARVNISLNFSFFLLFVKLTKQKHKNTLHKKRQQQVNYPKKRRIWLRPAARLVARRGAVAGHHADVCALRAFPWQALRKTRHDPRFRERRRRFRFAHHRTCCGVV